MDELELHKIGIKLDAVGRGIITLDGNEVHGVVALSVDISPAERFNKVTMTLIGPVEAELEVYSENIALQRLAGLVGVPDTPSQ